MRKKIETLDVGDGSIRPWQVSIDQRVLLDRVGRVRRFRSEAAALAYAQELVAL